MTWVKTERNVKRVYCMKKRIFRYWSCIEIDSVDYKRIGKSRKWWLHTRWELCWIGLRGGIGRAGWRLKRERGRWRLKREKERDGEYIIWSLSVRKTKLYTIKANDTFGLWMKEDEGRRRSIGRYGSLEGPPDRRTWRQIGLCINCLMWINLRKSASSRDNSISPRSSC